MSAGRFITNAVYQTDDGETIKIRVQPETLQLELAGIENGQALGEATLKGSAKVSAGRRTHGINARLVRITWLNAAPAGYDNRGIITLPWLVKTTFDQLPDTAEGTYLTFPVRLVGTTGEDIK